VPTGLTPGESRAFPNVPGYEVLGVLGHGGMGVVYKARQRKANRIVALKMIRAVEHASPHDRLRFQIETEAVARLQHPNIVQLYEVGESHGLPYFSLEFCDGGTLTDHLKKKPPTPREAAELIETLARAMHYAHLRGVVHRDLKPANVLLGADGAAKITDFGLAKRLDAEGRNVSQSGAVMGTAEYMAPEQAAGRVRDTGPAADVYALGVLLYQCLAGRPPFTGPQHVVLVSVVSEEPPSPSRFNARVPRDLETICLKCLAKEPERRYPDAQGLAEELHRWCAGEPIRARRVSGMERLIKWTWRRPAAAGLLAALVLLMVLVGVLFVVDYGRRSSEEQRAEAAAQRDRAQGLQVQEEQQRQRAEKAEEEARRQLERAEQLVYRGHMTQTQVHWREGNVQAARGFFDDCPWHLRGWEYAHLRQRFDETQATLRGHTKPIWNVCFSPDGKRIASASWDQTAKVWDADTGQELLTLKGHKDSVWGVCFSPDGKRLASASGDRTVKVWDPVTGQEVLTLKGHSAWVVSVSFSPDGQKLASLSYDGTIKVWEAVTGKELRTLQGQIWYIWPLCFSPDGKRLASGSSDHTVKVWDVATGQLLLTLKGHTLELRSVSFSPDGKRLASAAQEGTVKVWDATTGKELRTINGHPNYPATSVCFSPDGKFIASGGDDHMVKVWDAATGQELRVLKGHTYYVVSVSFSPDGKRLASGSYDQTVKVWDVATGQDLRTLERHTNQLNQVCFTPDSKLLACADDKAVKLWDAATGQEIRSFQSHAGGSKSICFSPKGKHLACGGNDRTVRVCDATTGQAILTLKGHTNTVTRVCYSPDGKRLASSSSDGTVKVWDTGTWEELRTLKIAGVAGSICFSPNGEHLAGATGQEASIWNLDTGQVIHTLKGHANGVESLCFGANGQVLISGSLDSTIKVWDVATG